MFCVDWVEGYVMCLEGYIVCLEGNGICLEGNVVCLEGHVMCPDSGGLFYHYMLLDWLWVHVVHDDMHYLTAQSVQLGHLSHTYDSMTFTADTSGW